MNVKIVAGITTFNPSIKRLKDNIEGIVYQVSKVIIVDNNSSNSIEIDELAKGYPTVIVCKNSENLGVATALNQMLEFAYGEMAEWLFTLDQDSVSDGKVIDRLLSYSYMNDVAIISPNIIDRNYNVSFDFKGEDFQYIQYCITSGSLMRCSSFKNKIRFDDKMFIDKVDLDICWQVIKCGLRIIKVNYDGLLHEVGNARKVNLFFRQYEIYNHAPFRRYYMCRNAKYLYGKYRDSYMFRWLLKEYFHCIIVFLFEPEKMKKLLSAFLGFRDGKKLLIKE